MILCVILMVLQNSKVWFSFMLRDFHLLIFLSFSAMQKCLTDGILTNKTC